MIKIGDLVEWNHPGWPKAIEGRVYGLVLQRGELGDALIDWFLRDRNGKTEPYPSTRASWNECVYLVVIS